MNDRGLVLLSLLTAVGVGVLGSYGLYAVLVNGGRFPEWLEDNGWVYPAVFGLGCALLAVSFVFALWPLAPVGAALAVLATARYFWLNV
jgi:hypothetical protein